MPVLPGAGCRADSGPGRECGPRVCAGADATPDQRRQAGAVVAAIFQPVQTFDENRFRFAGAGVTDDAAHACSSVNRWGGVIRVRCGKSEFTAIPHSRTRGFPSEKATLRFHKPAHHGFIRLREQVIDTPSGEEAVPHIS